MGTLRQQLYHYNTQRPEAETLLRKMELNLSAQLFDVVQVSDANAAL